MMPAVPMVLVLPKMLRVLKVVMVPKKPIVIMVSIMCMVLIVLRGACWASGAHGA